MPLMSSLLFKRRFNGCPFVICQEMLKGDLKGEVRKLSVETKEDIIEKNQKRALLLLGVFGLLSIPVFKHITGLPPFVGVLTVLGVLWVYTEFMYKSIHVGEHLKFRVAKVISRIDTATILFFLGILLAVMALQATGILKMEDITK